MRSLILQAGLTAALFAASLAGSPAPAAASNRGVDWTEGHHWWPGGRPYFWSPRPAWYGTWWPGTPAGGPWWGGEARVATVRRELTADDFRLRDDRLDGRLRAGEVASFRAEDSAIRAEANRDAAPWGGISYDQYLRLRGEVHALSAEIARADGMSSA